MNIFERIWEWIFGKRKKSKEVKEEPKIKRVKILYSPEYQAKLDRRRKRKRVEIKSRILNYKRFRRRG